VELENNRISNNRTELFILSTQTTNEKDTLSTKKLNNDVLF